jgi:hypothetical protein
VHDLVQACEEKGGVELVWLTRPGRHRSGRIKRVGHDFLGEHFARRMQRLLGQHEIHVLDGHRLDPLRVLARGRIVAGVVLQVAVVPGDVAFQQIARLLRACRVAGAQLACNWSMSR